ncbi:MAG: hypothetical protein NTX03_14605, partial [Bacteroidetes bacterium]|nr:hypothetical protein [Bacteroidota bacterium]
MKKKLHLIVLVFLCAFNSLFAQLNGTYTINPSGSGTKNFTTFKAAAKMLKDSGVNGAVVFSIANGIYNERVSIDTIKGTSKTNTVTFESASGDSSKVILDYGAGATADLYTLRLNGCSYINFNKITVQKSGGTNNYGIEVTGSAHHNKVSNCIVKAAKTASLCYVIYSATGIDSVNTFYNNYILNGYYKIYWDGGKKSEKKNEFIHNILDSSTYYGV